MKRRALGRCLVVSLVTGCLLGTSNAQADIPKKIPMTGTLEDLNGHPVTEPNLAISVTLLNDEGTTVFDEDHMVAINDGHFYLVLGENRTLDPEVFVDHRITHLALSIDGEQAQFPLGTVPYAAYVPHGDTATTTGHATTAVHAQVSDTADHATAAMTATTTALADSAPTANHTDRADRATSASNADKVQGKSASYFARSNHGHSWSCTTRSSSINVRNTMQSVTVSCPSGYRAVGGGASMQMTTDNEVQHWPDDNSSDNRWKCQGATISGVIQRTLTCYAHCCKVD